MYTPAPPALNAGQELHQVGVHFHDTDVGKVYHEQDEGLVPREHTIPGEPNEETD